jgi:hypothetical protein
MSSDIIRLLNQRGHKVTKEGSERDVFLPLGRDLDAELVASFKGILYSLMKRDSFRRALRDWAYGNLSDSNPNKQLIEAYCKLCEKFGSWDNAETAVQHRYTCTFEWYISELLRREFAAQASGFGLRLKDADPDDEFDCVALLDSGLVYAECKTGRVEIYTEIKKFLRRDAELDAAYSFFVFDRDYIFVRTGDDIPASFSWNKAYSLGIEEIAKVTVASHTFFQISGLREFGSGSRFFLVCSTFSGLEDRLRYMIRYSAETSQRRFASSLFRRQPIFFPSDIPDAPSAQPDQPDPAARTTESNRNDDPVVGKPEETSPRQIC